MSTPLYKYMLYTFFGSSCSARVRIACHLKGIPLEYRFVNLLKAGQAAPEYTELNPSQAVPLLVVTDAATGAEVVSISQSVAILEYLEETNAGSNSDVKLLPPPSDPVARAKVRELVGVVAADIQPVTNQRIVKYITPRGVDENEWQLHFMGVGLRAYEKIVSRSAGKWSVGDQISLADVMLVAAMDRANRYKVDVSDLPTVRRLDGQMRQTEAYEKGCFRSQPDTPEEMRQQRL